MGIQASVLDKYRDDPHYSVTDSRVSRKDGAPSHVELSSIQQYVWGHKADGSPCVVAILAHLCSLSTKDQEYWRFHELPPAESTSAKIDHRYANPMWYGESPDAVSGYDAILLYLREIQKVFKPDTLFPNFDGRSPGFLGPIAYSSFRAMASFAQDLHTLTSISLKTIASRIHDEGRLAVAAELRAKQESRNLLWLYFEDHGLQCQAIEEGLDALRELNQWRVKSAHMIVPAEHDKDYRMIQWELVDSVQRGLKAMLVAFTKAENAPVEAYRKYILDLRVD